MTYLGLATRHQEIPARTAARASPIAAERRGAGECEPRSGRVSPFDCLVHAVQELTCDDAAREALARSAPASLQALLEALEYAAEHDPDAALVEYTKGGQP